MEVADNRRPAQRPGGNGDEACPDRVGVDKVGAGVACVSPQSQGGPRDVEERTRRMLRVKSQRRGRADDRRPHDPKLADCLAQFTRWAGDYGGDVVW